MPNKIYVLAGLIVFALVVGTALVSRYSPLFSSQALMPTLPATDSKETTAIANPASVNCVEKGGSLEMAKKPDGSEYGICVFEGNFQCEEWALYRGECQVGGMKVTGFDTEAEVYCAISGMTVDGDTCTNGTSSCLLTAFYDGSCTL